MCYLMNMFISSSIIKPGQSNVMNFPLRGGIAKGPGVVRRKNNIHVGYPFMDAYVLAECQNWMGGAIHNSIFEDWDWIKEIAGYNDEIIRYLPIKMKDEANCHISIPKYALNWPKSHPYDHTIGTFHRPGPKYSDLEHHIKSYAWDPSSKLKNTLEFAKYVCNEWDTNNQTIMADVPDSLKGAPSFSGATATITNLNNQK